MLITPECFQAAKRSDFLGVESPSARLWSKGLMEKAKVAASRTGAIRERRERSKVMAQIKEMEGWGFLK